MRNNSTLLTYLFNDFESEAEGLNLDAEIEELLISMDIEDFCPKKNTVTNILNFARSYEILKSEKTGIIELNLN